MKGAQQPELHPQKIEQKHFECKCGRLYQSYSAVSTHIRVKHSKNQQYIRAIKRPTWANQRTPRHRHQKSGFINKQIEEINLFQIGLLNFVEAISQVTPNKSQNILLKGNQSSEIIDVLRAYSILNTGQYYLEYNLVSFTEGPSLHQQIKNFYFKFIKHLNAQISSKILWALNFLLYYGENIENIQMKNPRVSLIAETLWNGSIRPVQALIETFKQFVKEQEVQHREESQFMDEILQLQTQKQINSPHTNQSQLI